MEIVWDDVCSIDIMVKVSTAVSCNMPILILCRVLGGDFPGKPRREWVGGLHPEPADVRLSGGPVGGRRASAVQRDASLSWRGRR